MQRFYKIIVVPFLVVSFLCKAQYHTAFSQVKSSSIPPLTIIGTGVQNSSKKVFENKFLPITGHISATKPAYLISPNVYTSQLAFFCRTELLVEKAIQLPLRFRLGSVQYTDVLEGKTGRPMASQ